ncbi:MAG: hypothetical protein LIR25_02635 [bacterium]|nr:hypothetical protein [bacterium]
MIDEEYIRMHVGARDYKTIAKVVDRNGIKKYVLLFEEEDSRDLPDQFKLVRVYPSDSVEFRIRDAHGKKPHAIIRLSNNVKFKAFPYCDYAQLKSLSDFWENQFFF